ncbi:Protoporphyrinogen oxidase [Penicillium frequentans]|uniref:Protoporphyrinogen oxidase n=1 Tax=Penicillium frequentans TaxID=3151616 RepID=A0AAD6D627_9EURO|nr:Protoporphyrinogen oxidase [Penicillium glabrum]
MFLVAKCFSKKAAAHSRPAGASGLTTLSMIHHLGLEEELLTCSTDSAAARNRYVYYPDRLIRVPSSLAELPKFLLFEPLAKGIIPGILNDYLKPYKSVMNGNDASVADVISDRLHPDLVNLVSAVLHGIYAGNVQTLGFNAIFPQLDYYMKQHGGIVRGMLYNMRRAWYDEVVLPLHDVLTMQQIMRDWEARRDKRLKGHRMEERTAALQEAKRSSIYSFKKGIQQLPDKMEEVLRRDPRVSIETGCSVSSIHMDETHACGGLLVKTGANGETERHFTHVISTIPSTNLGELLCSDHIDIDMDEASREIMRILQLNKTVNVMVVNLWFAELDLLPVKGFGYLIPKETPAGQNPECGLGVIFDSDALQGQDTVQGTKLTVMLGGYYWDNWPGKDLPSALDGISKARSLLSRHLGITAEPMATCATMRRNCIPQYGTHHLSRMRNLRQALQDKYKGRLVLAGSSYDGVGVSDCIRSGVYASHSLHSVSKASGGLGGALFKSHTDTDDPGTFVSVSQKHLRWNFP